MVVPEFIMYITYCFYILICVLSEFGLVVLTTLIVGAVIFRTQNAGFCSVFCKAICGKFPSDLAFLLFYRPEI
jgi:hypothetical protein